MSAPEVVGTEQGARTPHEFDAIVVGTGFGGAVTACRLVEAGYKICGPTGPPLRTGGLSDLPD